MLLSDRLAQVYAGPEGPQVAAFFDFDGTLIHGFSAVDFYLDRIRSGKVGPLEAIRTTALALRGVETEEDFEKLVAIGLSGLDGHHQDDVTAVGERVFAKKVAARVYPEAWQLVQAHHRMGHTVVLASSATRFQLEAAARTLGIDHVLSTTLEAGDDGILTGRAHGPTLWRAGKANAVRIFGAEHDIDLEASYAYSNGNEDIDFLSQVGFPAATTPEDRLREHATAEGWPVLDFRSRGLPSLPTIARSAAAMGGILTGIGTGAAFGLLNGSRRTAISSIMALSSEYSLALAGVRVDTIGEQHVWEQRPAVFVFNHQSQLDVFVICYLLRRDFTGVAKQELTKDPIFGPVFRFAGVAFVDRRGRGQPPRCPGARGGQAQRRHLRRHRPRGHPLTDADPRRVQDRCVPPRPRGRCAGRPDRDPQRRRADVARLADDQARHRPGGRAAADRRLGLARRPGPQQDPRGAGPVRGHPRPLARRPPPRPQGPVAAEEEGRQEGHARARSRPPRRR